MRDSELLQQYAQTRSPQAFAELVRRHAGLVYSAALRRVRDPHLADDVTQATFLLLSQKAGRLPRDVALGGWLYNTALYAAKNALRSEHRRRRHEQRASALRPEQTSQEADVLTWERLEPLLDEAMQKLSDADRQLVLMRYFQRRNYDEVCAAIGVSEAAATKRLSRAIEKLRHHLAKRGVTGSASMLSALITDHAIRPAPPHVIDAASNLMNASTSAGVIAKGVSVMQTWAKVKFAAAMVSIVAVVGGGAVATARLSARPDSSGAAGAAGDHVFLALWEVAVDPQLADAIKKIAKPVKSDSTGFESFVADSNALQQLLADPLRQKKLLHVDWRMIFIEPKQMQGFRDGYSFMWSGNGTLEDAKTKGTLNYKWAPLFNQVHGKVKMDARKDRAHLSITSTLANVAMRTSKIANASTKFEGDLTPGKTLLFLGRIPPEEGFEPTVIMAWQLVAIPREQAAYVKSVGKPAEWLGRGLESITKDAAEAVAWDNAAHSPDDSQPPRWMRKLSGGATVKLAAVTGPPARPWEWWDGDGAPVKMGTGLLTDGEKRVSIDIADPNYHGKGGGSANFASYGYRDGFVRVTVPVKKLDRFRLRCGTGDWTDVGILRKGDVLKSGGGEFRLTRFDPMGRKNASYSGNTFADMQFKRGDREIAFAAVDKTGKQTFATMAPDVRPENTPGASEADTLSSFFPLDIDDIDHFLIKSRPMEWIEFAGVATKHGRRAESIATTKPQPAADSPEAAMAVLADAMEAGDLPKAKSFTRATGAAAEAVNDAMLEQTIAATKVKRAAIAKFGAAEIARGQDNRRLMLPDHDRRRTTRYRIDGDTAKPIDTESVKHVGPGLRRIDGTWKLAMELPPGTDEAAVLRGVENIRKHAKALNDIAGNIASNKYPDADALADAIDAANQAAR